jgi:hypothetical protein
MNKQTRGYDTAGDVRTGRPPLPINVANKKGSKKAIGDKHVSSQNPATDGGIIPKKTLADNTPS